MRTKNGKIYIRYQLDGVEYCAPTGLEANKKNEPKALAMEAAHRQSVLDGRNAHQKIKAVPFIKAAEMFLSWAETEYKKRSSYLRIRSSFSFLKEHFGSQSVASITDGHLEHLKVVRRKMDVKEVSIRHDLHALSVFFQYCVKQRWCRENPVKTVAIPSDADAVRIKVLSPDEERGYFEACLLLDKDQKRLMKNWRGSSCFADLYDFGRLMIQQGCRPEELFELEKASVNLAERTIHIRTGKTKSANRVLKLTRESAAILKRRISSQFGPYVFPSPVDPQKHRMGHMRGHGAVLREIGAQFVVYDFRHTWASRACMKGMPLPVVAAILGHSPRNLRSVMHYVHVSADDIAAEMEKLDGPESVRNRENVETANMENNPAKDRKSNL